MATLNYGRYGRDLLVELQRCRDTSAVSAATSAASLVPQYNDSLVALTLQDLRLHVQALNDQHQAVLSLQAAAASGSSTNKPSMAVRPSILLQTSAIHRNKQCLLAYHVERLKRLSHLYWQGCEVVADDANNVHEDNNTADEAASNNNNNKRSAPPTTALPPLLQACCPAERDFITDYQELVSRYAMANQFEPDDLRAFAAHPPLSATDRVQVRVVTSPSSSTTPTTDDSAVGEQQELNHNEGPIVLESGAVVTLKKGSTHYLLWTDVEEYVRKGILQVLEGEEEG